MLKSDQRIFSVASLTKAIKGNLEASFPFVWVRGQVTNVSRPSSGHVYFSLRDDEASLAAVWFKQSQNNAERFDPLTGEVFEDDARPNTANLIENGQELICAGRLTVYAPRGNYQLLVEFAENAGLGKLQEEFKKLQAKLSLQGYFTEERKRPLPLRPQRIAVVTSPSGAAIHDFLRISESRGLGAKIRIYPVSVQGEVAGEQIAKAIENINSFAWAEIIVLIRGGGSLEDLWSFNTETVAKAVFESKIPVLAGIGHETDFTLADLTADKRAATPSHAAQLILPERSDLLANLIQNTKGLKLAWHNVFERKNARLALFQNALNWQNPVQKMLHWEQRLENLNLGLHKNFVASLNNKKQILQKHQAVINLAPQRLPAHKARFVHLRQQLNFFGQNILAPYASSLMQTGQKLSKASENIHNYKHIFHTLDLRLNAGDPYAPLEKGYAFVTNLQGQFIKSSVQTNLNEKLEITFKDGKVPVVVTGKAHE